VIWDAGCSSMPEEQDVSDDAAEKNMITWENLGCVSEIIIRRWALNNGYLGLGHNDGRSGG
jgi:hypothetical protein